MGSQQIQVVPPFDGGNFNGPTRTIAGYARFLVPTLDVEYGEKMRGIYVGSGGNVSIEAWDGSTIQFVGLLTGVLYPIYSLKINSVGTSASSLVVMS